MKEHLSMKETLYISVMLFGLFFGAGNLIFPVYLGHMAGGNVWRAAAGFLITGVGLPLLGVAALGVSRSGGLLELSSRVGEKYGYFFAPGAQSYAAQPAALVCHTPAEQWVRFAQFAGNAGPQKFSRDASVYTRVA